MRFVDVWVHEEKTPVPQKQIISKMAENGTKDFTAAGAIKTLLLKGYLRKTNGASHTVCYVQLRRV